MVRDSGSISTNPSPNDLINLSLRYYKQGEYQKCIDACLRALSLDRGSVLAYNNMCSAYNQLEDYDNAIAACEKALALKPDYERARNNLRAARTKKGKLAP